MKKLIALMLVASFTGAVIAQQAVPQQTAPATKMVEHRDDKDKDKDKKHHRHHHHRHHEKKEAAPAK